MPTGEPQPGKDLRAFLSATRAETDGSVTFQHDAFQKNLQKDTCQPGFQHQSFYKLAGCYCKNRFHWGFVDTHEGAWRQGSASSGLKKSPADQDINEYEATTHAGHSTRTQENEVTPEHWKDCTTGQAQTDIQEHSDSSIIQYRKSCYLGKDSPSIQGKELHHPERKTVPES